MAAIGSQYSVTVSSGFIDLSTYQELEGFIYGGANAITHFVAAVIKSNWFSVIPVPVRNLGTFDFNQKNVSVSINRSGDYVLNVWFNCKIPQIYLYQSGSIFLDATIRWTRNLMHNLMESVNITFNELVVQQFDNFWLDFNFMFRVRGSKRIGYRTMIGDIASMTTPVALDQPLGNGGYFSCVLPFFFGEDSGIALPVAALPFNDVKVNYNFRNWSELVVIYPGTSAVGGPSGPGTGAVATTADVYVYGSTTTKPSLVDPTTYCHYAIVHNDERVKMGDAPRDILMHQIQNTQRSQFRDFTSAATFDLRLSHSIVTFAFAARNNTLASEWSNYTTEPNYAGLDPLAHAALIYENTTRLAMRSDYYSLVQPFFQHKAIPDETGYHIWSYALQPWDPVCASGSTNYSALANVSMQYLPSPAALASMGSGTTSGGPEDQNGNPIQWPNSAGVLTNQIQTYQHIFAARSWNIGRVANGSFGHPTL